MDFYSAKTRGAMKAKAKRLAAPGNYSKDQMTSSADWSPAEPIKAETKTGMRPISPRAYKRGGAVKKASGGEIADSLMNRNIKKANEERPGGKDHVGGLKKGGKVKRAEGGGVLDKKAVGAVEVRPTRAKAEHYKKGGKVKKAACGGYADGGLASKLNKLTGYKSESQKQQEAMPDPSKNVVVDYRKMKSDTDKLDRMTGYKKGGKAGEKWIQSAIKKPGALHKQLGVPAGEKIPAKKLEKAAEKGGKLGQRARLAETLKGMRKARATGGAADASPLSTAAKSVRSGRAEGGRKKAGKMTDIKINILASPKPAAMADIPPIGAMIPPGGGAPVPPMASPAAPPAAALGAMPPAMTPGIPARKAGGRISKFAKSYKDMQAGAGSGEGRLQKTDIAKKVRAK